MEESNGLLEEDNAAARLLLHVAHVRALESKEELLVIDRLSRLDSPRQMTCRTLQNSTV